MSNNTGYRKYYPVGSLTLKIYLLMPNDTVAWTDIVEFEKLVPCSFMHTTRSWHYIGNDSEQIKQKRIYKKNVELLKRDTKIWRQST